LWKSLYPSTQFPMTPKRESESRNDENVSTLLDPAPFPKEMFDNRRGKTNDDLSAVLARAVFEYNLEAIYEGMSREVIKGNATVFKALAERGYGKLQEADELTDQIGVIPDGELDERNRQLERELGFPRETGQAE